MTTAPRTGYVEFMLLGAPATRPRIVEPRRQDGFTLPEMLAALIVIAVLVAIAVPLYLGQREKASDIGAGASVRQALPAIEAYFQDNGTYVGMTTDALRSSYEPALHSSLVLADLTPTSYCAQATFSGRTWSFTTGGALVSAGC